MTTYTREQVSRAVNDGADLVLDGLGCNDRDTDLISLVVNAALTLLDAASLDDLDEIIRRCYDTDPQEVHNWCT